MYRVKKQGSKYSPIAVVEIQKSDHLYHAAMDTRTVTLLRGSFEDAGFDFKKKVALYSFVYTDNSGRIQGLKELRETLRDHALVITIGADATRFLCRTQYSLTKFHGSLTWDKDLKLWFLPTYHPSVVYVGPRETLNKRYAQFDIIFDHIHRAVDLITGVLKFPDPETRMNPCPQTFIGHKGSRVKQPDSSVESWSGYWESTEEEADQATHVIQAWLDELDSLQSITMFSLDTESRGLNVFQENSFTMMQVYDGKEAYAFTCGVVKHPRVLPLVLRLLNHTRARWILHNCQHDRQVLWHSLGVDLGGRDVDTMCLALGTTEQATQVGLKYQARQNCNAPFYEEAIEQYLTSKPVDYSRVPPDVLAWYGNLDVYYTYQLREILAKKVEKEGTGQSVKRLLIPGQRAFGEISYAGMRVDLELAKKTSEEWKPVINTAIEVVQDYAREAGFPQDPEIVKGQAYKKVCGCVPARARPMLENAGVSSYRRILRESGYGVARDTTLPQHMEDCTRCGNRRYITKLDNTLNVNSPLQMQHLVFDILGMKELPHEGRTTKKEFWELNGNHPLSELVGEYKELLFLRRNFLERLKDHVREDGRIHPDFLLFGTTTGRLSVQNPGMQTIPKHGKNAKAVCRLFLPDENELVVNVDYKSLEMFIAHHLTKDPNLLKVLTGKWDIHTALATRVYNKKPETVTPEERQSVKSVNFGAGYNITGAKLAMDPAMEKATGGDPRKAQKFLDEFWGMYPVWKLKGDQWKLQALTNQFLTTELGRKRRWNLITRDNRKRVENQAMNFAGQSMASDLCLLSLIKLHELMKSTGWGRVMLTVHDSLLFSVKRGHMHEAVNLIQQVMTTPEFETTTPFSVDVQCGTNYGDLYQYDPDTDYTTWNTQSTSEG